MMTTTNVEMLVGALNPGRVVYVRGGQSSKFGIVCPIDFWNKKASLAARNLCGETSIPLLLLNEDLTWGLYFANKTSVVVQNGNLLSSSEEFLRYCELFSCFTERDGSRYYFVFFKKLCAFGNICYETLSNNLPVRIPLQKIDQEFFDHLMKWKEEQKVGQGLVGACGVIEHPLALGLSLRDK